MPSSIAVAAVGDGRMTTVLIRSEGETRTTLVWVRIGGRWLLDEAADGGGQELTPRDVEDFRA